MAVVTLTATLALGSCDPGARTARDRVELRDSLGVTIVVNHGESDTTFTLEPELRIGSLDAATPELFSEVVAVGVTPDGSIVVGDAMSTSVRIFDRDGAFLREFGGRGDGPREISQLDDVIVVGDTILLVDWQRGGTVLRFSASGQFAASMSMTSDDHPRLAPMAHDGQSWLAYEYGPRTRILEEGEPLDDSAVIRRFVWDSSSAGPQAYSRVAAHMYGVRTGSPSVDWPLFGRVLEGDGFDGSGRYHDASLTHYAVQIWNAEGLERVVRRTVPRVPVSAEVVAEVRATAVHVVDSLTREAPTSVRDQQVEQIEKTVNTGAAHMRTDSVPPIAGLIVGSDGTFWVKRRDGPDLAQVEGEAMFRAVLGASRRTTRWDVFAPDGRFRGTLELPARTQVHAVSEHHAWGVALDDLDVPFVFRWALTALTH